jgi:hypothetical protein
MKRCQMVARLVLALTILFLSLERSSAVARAASAARGTPDFAAIDDYIEGEMRELRIPGLALGIV